MLIRNNIGRLFMTGFLFAVIVMGVFILNTKKFEASTDFLIVQNGVNDRDLYALSKSAEYIGNVLSDAIYSDLFIDEAIKVKKFDSAGFLPDPRMRLEEWKKVVDVDRNFQSSILTVRIKGNDGQQVLDVSRAVAQVLAEKNTLFRAGNSNDLTVKVLSGPRLKQKPTLSEWMAVGAAGFLVGILLLGTSIFVSHEMKKGPLA